MLVSMNAPWRKFEKSHISPVWHHRHHKITTWISMFASAQMLPVEVRPLSRTPASRSASSTWRKTRKTSSHSSYRNYTSCFLICLNQSASSARSGGTRRWGRLKSRERWRSDPELLSVRVCLIFDSDRASCRCWPRWQTVRVRWPSSTTRCSSAAVTPSATPTLMAAWSLHWACSVCWRPRCETTDTTGSDSGKRMWPLHESVINEVISELKQWSNSL